MTTIVQERNNSNVPSLSGAQFPERPPRLAWSVRETAEALGVSEKTIRRLVARRLLNPSRALRHLLISQKEVERFLKDTTA
jgi:excisionase family DNA binding protein